MAAMETATGDLWVFGYGSLLWDPCFDPVERVLARLHGWHRSFCMWSIHHRGSPEAPGLVLALDAAPGAFCDGLAFRVAATARAAALAALRDRELISSAYREVWLPVHLADGRVVQAVSYVIDRHHAQYTGPMALAEQARVIAAAIGGRGPNRDYLLNTHAHLQALGLRDDDMAWLAEAMTGTV